MIESEEEHILKESGKEMKEKCNKVMRVNFQKEKKENE